MKLERVAALSWAELNTALRSVDDETELELWLAAMRAAGRRTCTKRVLGRLRAVRKAKEYAALPPKKKEDAA